MNENTVTIITGTVIWMMFFMMVKYLSPRPTKKKAKQVIRETQSEVEEILRAWNKNEN